MTDSHFIFIACQPGAEPALKAEMARLWPDYRLAFSRRGYVTFKLPPGVVLSADFQLGSVFARAAGIVLGKVQADSSEACAAAAKSLAATIDYETIHLWTRSLPLTEALPSAATALSQAQGWPSPDSREGDQSALLRSESATTSVKPILDCTLIEPNQWWLGYHQPTSPQSHWPGGIFPEHLPEHAVSRAYLKMAEALAWSQLPVARGDRVAEIGCAPGGASQALLERGLHVMGIDPALVDERVLAYPHFTYVRKRGHEVKRRDFRDVKWLTADMNVAPQYTLDTAEDIVQHESVHIRGMLLTLKLLEWSLAEQIAAYLERIRSWGFKQVSARQLSHNRQEICVAATK